MRQILANENLVAYCGLYCGACGKHLADKCPGCHENAEATWCKVRSCCLEHSYSSCAPCEQFADPNDCAKFHNFFSRIMALLFNSNRQACILKIKQVGLDAFSQEMTQKQAQSLPRR